MADHVIHISENEAASDFASVLARVRAGAEVVIDAAGGSQPVAVIHAPAPPRRSWGERNFFARSTIGELAAEQDVKPLGDGSELAGGLPEDVNLDEFLAVIYDARN